MEKGACFFAGLKEGFDPLAQGGVAGACLLQVRGAPFSGQSPRRAEDGDFALEGFAHWGLRVGSTKHCGKPSQKAQSSSAIVEFSFSLRALLHIINQSEVLVGKAKTIL